MTIWENLSVLIDIRIIQGFFNSITKVFHTLLTNSEIELFTQTEGIKRSRATNLIRFNLDPIYEGQSINSDNAQIIGCVEA